MSGETLLTLIGSLTAAPELRFTPNGAAVANFTIASNSRHLDRQSGEWVDDPPLFMRCNLWKQPAENAVESLEKGTRVIVQGRLKQRSFENREGQKVTVMELEVDEIGPSLRWATAKVNKVSRGSGGGDWNAGNGGGGGAAQADPWASAGAGGVDDSPPPF